MKYNNYENVNSVMFSVCVSKFKLLNPLLWLMSRLMDSHKGA